MFTETKFKVSGPNCNSCTVRSHACKHRHLNYNCFDYTSCVRCYFGHAFIKKYFERYVGVQDFIEASKEVARKTGMATTMFGRKRPIPEILNKNGMIRAQAERLAVNTPLQGTQADIIKKAMIEIQNALKDSKIAHMVLQIHDELIFELPDENIEETSEIVRNIMENITSLSVPLIANIDVGKNWGEC